MDEDEPQLDLEAGQRSAIAMLVAYRGARSADDLGDVLNTIAAEQPLWTTTIGLLQLGSELLDYLSGATGQTPDDILAAIGEAQARRQLAKDEGGGSDEP